ncbi:CHAT domain-containing protein [Catalinimonas alkaloidigena]|uniref:CHAT domain-containing protein n=1 Tax=Catalinimonas alkaloidigena TaxID=1075417 RepID=UPI002404F093|nr:CHAT domain-containing protein [Catalinimonas alkaloidigena]
MKKIFLIILFFFPLLGYTQHREEDYEQVKNLYEDRKYEEALSLGVQYLASAKQQAGVKSAIHAQYLKLLVLISYSAGWNEQGREYAQQEVALRKLLNEQPPKAYAESLYNLAVLKLNNDDPFTAIQLFEQSEKLFQSLEGEQDELSQLHLFLADAYIQAHQYQQADSLLVSMKSNLSEGTEEGVQYYLAFKKSKKAGEVTSLDYLEQAVHCFEGSTDKNTLIFKGETLYAMASEYLLREDFDKAFECYADLNKLFENNQLKDSLRWASVLNNLGRLSLKIRPEEARAWLKQAYTINVQFTRPEDDRLWASIDNYAMALYEQGKAEDAIQLYNQHQALLTDTTGVVDMAYVSALNNKALIHKDKGESETALDCLYQAEKILNQLDLKSKSEQLRVATLYYNFARTYQELTQHDSAIYYYKRSTEISKLANASLSSEYLAAITGMAALYQDIGLFTESEIFYQEALRIQNTLGGKENNVYASILSNYALLHQEKGDFKNAKQTFDEALSIKRQLLGLDHPEYIAVLSNLGLLALEQANYEQARRMLETVLIKNENLYGEMHPLVAQNLSNLARLEVALGSYPEAEPLLKQALDIQKSIYSENHPAYAITAIEMANFYMQLGNYDAAEPLLMKSRDVLRKSYGRYHPDYATATQNLASLYEIKGNNQLAENYLLETLEIDEQTLGKQHPSYAIALNSLASFYQNNDDLSKAEPLLKEAQLICQNSLGKEHPLYSTILLNLSLLYQDLEAYERAAPLLDEVVSLRAKLLGKQHPDYAYALYGKAVNSYRLKQYTEVEGLFEEVINLYSLQLKEYFPALSEKEKSAFYQRIEPVLNSYRDFAMNMNLKEGLISPQSQQKLLSKLYNLQLITKAMLLDASSRIRRSIFQSGDEDLIELYEEWLLKKEQLAKYYTLSSQELTNRKLNISAVEEDANELEKKLSASSQIFARSLENRMLTWKDVQSRLQPGEAAVEVLRISKNQEQPIVYIALIVEPGQASPKLTVLPDGQAMETKNFNYYKNAIEYHIEDELSYALYWRGIGEALSAEVKTVYFAPDGVYNKISLNSLYNQNSKTFLLDEINLRMLSSTRELTEDVSEGRTDPYKEALILGYPDYQLDLLSQAEVPYLRDGNGVFIDGGEFKWNKSSQKEDYNLHPLPGTRVEVNTIERMMQAKNWRVKKLTEAQAKEEAIKQVLMPDVLHFATHGYFLSDLPLEVDQRAFGIHMQNVSANPLLRSGLLLAGAASVLRNADSLNLEMEDGVLTAYEAMNLNLSGTDLVVLSACETGLGEVKNGEGVYGLQRAFLVAGAKSVLMSLWKVDDASTTELISLFYENWLSGQSKSLALLNAQRTMREKYEEPYHWAGFVLIGR